MIDLHCHLDLYPNVMSFINEVRERNRYTLVVTTSPRAWQATSQVFKQVSNIECAIGMHPEIVAQKYNEKRILLENITNCRFIGEVGIDGSTKYATTLDMQTEVFKEVLQQSQFLGGRIISIHSRNAATRVLDIIEESGTHNTHILHWFSGSLTELDRAISIGCLFSMGPKMMDTKNGREIVSRIPPDRILPESDGPFARLRDKPVMPWEAMNIVPIIAEVYGLQEDKVALQIMENYESLMLVAKSIKKEST